LKILVEGWFPPFLDIVFTVSFIFLILLFILVIVDGVKLEERERSFKVFYLPKIVLLGFFWFAVVVAMSWAEYNELIDPTITIQQSPVVITFEIMVLIVLLLYFFWLSYATCRACGLDTKKAFLKRRLRFFLFFSASIIIIIGFGILFDYFQHPNNAAEFLSFHSLSNLYVYVLAIVYLPSKESQTQGYSRNLQITTLEDDDEDVFSLDNGNPGKKLDLDPEGELELENFSESSLTN